jgi:hypothetical protein
MNARPSLRGLAQAVVVAVLALCACAAEAAGTKRALLIGINRYKAVPSLQGSVNDVQTMREILVSRWGFPPDNVTMLLDQAATRSAILAAMRKLVDEAGPDDVVYLHYSGHGSQVQDLNGDEDDGLDETIVPQDGRTPGVRDIVDDELDAIFAKLRTPNAVIVLDSCHSGTAMRSLDIRTRSVPNDTRIDLYRDGNEVATRAIVPRLESRFLVLSGAADNQEAIDGPIDGRYHGFFTYALSRSVSTLPPQATPRQIFGGVAQELARLQARFGRVAMPDPRLEGPPAALDQPLFGRGLDAPPTAGRLAWAEVAAGPAGAFVLRNGAALGAAPGSTWAVYPPGETRFASGRALALATVSAVRDADSIATPVAGAPPIPAGARAVLAMPPPAAGRAAVRVLEMPGARRREVEETLRRALGSSAVAGPGDSARFTIDVLDSNVRLLSADGRQVVASFDAGDPAWGAKVGQMLARSVAAEDLLGLDNPAAQLRVTARAAGAPGTATRSIVRVGGAAPAPYVIRRDGDARRSDNSLQLEITVSEDAYLTVVDVDPEGAINVLYPNDYQKPGFLPDGRVRANQTVRIPDSLAPGNQAGFYWDYTPPAGTDTVRVFASRDLAVATMLRERIRAAQAARGTAMRGLAAPPPAAPFEALRRDLAGVATRGIHVVADTGVAPGPAAATASGPVTPVAGVPTAPVVAAPAAFVGSAPGAAGAAPGGSGDWAAATVTISIRD